MAEGGMSRILETIRRPFLKKPGKLPSADSSVSVQADTQTPSPESVIPQPNITTEQKQPPDYRKQAAQDIFGAIRLQAGENQTNLTELIRSNPLLKDTNDEDIQRIINAVKSPETQKPPFDLARCLPAYPTKEEKQGQKTWVYEKLIQPTSTNSQKTDVDQVINQVQAEVLPNTNVDKLKPKRPIIIEKDEASLPIGSDEDLKDYVYNKVKIDIPPENALAVIDYLATADPKELIQRYKKRVQHGVFEGYGVVPRGKTGRILFRIDSEGQLHIRLGKHDNVYATTKKVS